MTLSQAQARLSSDATLYTPEYLKWYAKQNTPKGKGCGRFLRRLKGIRSGGKMSMDIIATIKHNDPEIDERVSLGIVAEDGGFAIRTATGEDAGQYRWATEGEAKVAIAHLWSAGAWDLQWEI